MMHIISKMAMRVLLRICVHARREELQPVETRDTHTPARPSKPLVDRSQQVPLGASVQTEPRPMQPVPLVPAAARRHASHGMAMP